MTKFSKMIFIEDLKQRLLIIIITIILVITSVIVQNYFCEKIITKKIASMNDSIVSINMCWFERTPFYSGSISSFFKNGKKTTYKFEYKENGKEMKGYARFTWFSKTEWKFNE